MARIRKHIWTAVIGLCFAGLGFGLAEWMANPPRFDLSDIEFAHATREEDNMPVVEIFYATNRAPVPGTTDFSGDPAPSLSYGIAEVRIPEQFRMTDVQRPEIPRGGANRAQACILSVTPLTPEEFHKTLLKRLAVTNSKRSTVFVHGIQNSFDSAIRQAGTLAFCLNLPQPMVVFSWDTDPGLSPSAYARCREQVPAAARAFREFLRAEGAEHFDILAHSLGCKVVCAALVQADSPEESPTPSVDPVANAILVAPDVNREDFENVFLKPGGSQSRHTTVYVARNDKALVFSSILNGGPRAGSGIDPTTALESLFDENGGDGSRIEIVDATFVNNAHTSHGYFYQNRAAFADVQNLLRNDLPACQRQLLRHERAKHGNYWIIPP